MIADRILHMLRDWTKHQGETAEDIVKRWEAHGGAPNLGETFTADVHDEWEAGAFAPSDWLEVSDILDTTIRDACNVDHNESSTAVVIGVRVEIRWGRVWTGQQYEDTVGKGMYVQVTQWGAEGLGMFDGSPCGSAGSEEAALADFIARVKYEYKGDKPLTVHDLRVTERRDYRE